MNARRDMTDILRPYETRSEGNQSLLSRLDHITKWPEAIPMRDKTVLFKPENTKILPHTGCIMHSSVKKHYFDAGLLCRNQYSEGPAVGHLDTGFS